MHFFTGTHGVGKTTIAKKLKDINPNLCISDGISRVVKEIKKEIGLSDYSEQIIINKLLFKEFEDNKSNSNYIATRSIIDCTAYSYLIGFDELGKQNEILINSIIEDIKHVKFIYIPIEFELIEDDGVRFLDKEFQMGVDKLIKELLEKYSISYKEITGTVEERIEKILNYL